MKCFNLGIKNRFDVYKKKHLYHSLREGCRISISLYDEIDDLPNAAILKERILSQFTDDRGAYKRTHACRFDAFDEAVLKIIKDRLPHRALMVHDIGASDARTSCDFFQKLLTLGRSIAFYASDHCPELLVLAHAGIKIVISPEGNLVEVVFPPFVFSASNLRERFGLLTRLLRFTALRVAAPILLRAFKTGRIRAVKTIDLFGSRARRLAREDGRFQLLKYNVLDQSPIGGLLTVIRAMNVLNVRYFSDVQALAVLGNIFAALEDGGLFVSGSNLEAGTPVDGAVYQKRGMVFESVWTSGAGHPFQNALCRFNEASVSHD